MSVEDSRSSTGLDELSELPFFFSSTTAPCLDSQPTDNDCSNHRRSRQELADEMAHILPGTVAGVVCITLRGGNSGEESEWRNR